MSRDADRSDESDRGNSSSGGRTRRQALKAVSATALGGTLVPGIASARRHDGASAAVDSHAPDWWQLEERGGAEDVGLVSEGADEWVREDREAPEWFSIGEEDELEYKPHGVFSMQGAGLCLPTSVKIGNVTVGLEACHYGGCEWKVQLCAGACIGTGMKDSCHGYYSLGVNLGVVNGSLQIDPRGRPAVPYSTVIVLEELSVSGELCYYYFLGSDCKTVDHTFDYS